MSLRAAVVGTSFGGRTHVPALRRATRLGIERSYTSLADALSLGLDAVSIAGPPATHAPLAIEAARAGVHVLCEQPFTRTAAEGPGTRAELPTYNRLAEALREAIGGTPAVLGPSPATFADGLAVMVVLDAVRLSAGQGGRWVSIGEENRG